MLWAFLLLVFARGLGDIVSDADPPAPAASSASTLPGEAERAFAVRVARAYLSWQPGEAGPASAPLDGLLDPNLRDRFERSRRAKDPGQSVIEATVSASEPVTPDRAVVTVMCFIQSGGRTATRYIAVPVARDGRGGLAAYDLPAFVAGPRVGDVQVSEPAALSGADAGEIDQLVRRFLAAYIAGASAEDLALFLAPGATVGSVGPGLELSEVSAIGQLEGGDPTRTLVVATVEVRDAESGASYPARYRLELARGERWFVESIEGEVR